MVINATDNTSFNPERKEIVFGLFKQSLAAHGAVRRLNILFYTCCITSILTSQKIAQFFLSEFVNKINFKYKVEKCA